MRRWALPAVLLVGALLRIPSLRVAVLNEDEALYAAGAVAMAEGAPPYRAWTDSKPPGIFYAYQGAFALVGRYHLRAVHALTIVWVLATALVVARLGGTWAALFYVVYTTVQEPSVLATQGEILYALPLALAALCLVRRGGIGAAVLAGGLVGVGTLLKPTAISLELAALVWLLGRRELGRAGALVVGTGAVWAALWAAMTHLGVWDDLVFFTFRWPLSLYIPAGFETLSLPARFLAKVGPWMLVCIVPFALAVRAVLRKEPVALFVLWTVAALVMLCLGGRFFDQYFPAVVTPLSVLAGLGARGLTRRALVLAGTALPALVCCAGAFFYDDTMRLLGEKGGRPYADLAQALRDEGRGKMFVWGYFPVLYVAAERPPATRFVACNLLTGYSVVSLADDLPPDVEDRFQLPGGLEQLLADLEAQKPAIFVDTAPADLHHWRRFPLSRYPALASYVAAHYAPFAVRDGAVLYRRLP